MRDCSTLLSVPRPEPRWGPSSEAGLEALRSLRAQSNTIEAAYLNTYWLTLASRICCFVGVRDPELETLNYKPQPRNPQPSLNP